MISLKERLMELLIKNKLISKEDLNKALAEQKEKGGRLSEILVKLKLVNENDLAIVLSQSLGLPSIELSRVKIPPEVIKIIPKDVARYYQIMPVSKIGNSLTLAIGDPLNIFAIDNVKTLTGFEINTVVARPKEILESIDAYYTEDSHKVLEEIIDSMGKDAQLELVKTADAENSMSSEELQRLTQEAPVIKLTEAILRQGIESKASDILIEPMEKQLRIRFRIDGTLKPLDSPPKTLHPSIVSRIKVMSQLDIAEHRLPQDGRFKVKLSNREVDFRVSILPTGWGEKVALRILDKTTALLDINKLGFEGKALETIKMCASKPHGMILVCGPTGSGKTTTLYSALKYIDSPEKNIITVEDPVEYQLLGINQVTARPDIGLTFASSLRSILRQDPDIIMIGEIRDFDTVDIAIKAALTGHLVVSTLHTTTAPGSIVRLLNMGVEPFLITSSMIAIVAQRLIRRICGQCREPFRISAEMAKRLNISVSSGEPPAFYKGRGCKACLQSGFRGRVCICEIVVLTPRIKDLILARSEDIKIKEAARSEGMITLREDGIKKALAGLSTLEEILKVTASDNPIGK
ncbi:GspE/PulE family protein [Candidatus Omnitrophota bacterium]